MMKFKEKPCAACGGMFTPPSRVAKFCRLECYFEGNTKKGGDDECWNWFGPHAAGRYAICNFRPQYDEGRVTRIILGIVDQPHLLACHRCDNPECVNPKHLFVGTPAENVTDMVNKGRNNRGENRWEAKLTEEQVRIIRTSKLTSSGLARQFGVSQSAVWLARAGKTWRHV